MNGGQNFSCFNGRFERYFMISTQSTIRLLIFEDNDDLRESLSILFKGTPGIVFTGAYPDCSRLLEDIEATQPNVILMDIDMPGISGIEAVWKLKQNFPAVQVLMLTVFDDNERVFQSICAGASGYLLKRTPPARIIESVFEVAEGGGPMTASIARKVLDMFPRFNAAKPDTGNLSPREQEILSLLVKGHTYKTAASELKISVETIRTHIKRIYEKLHVHNSREAVSVALKKRLI
jgi:DNA-binding NarL/FixJ family response regulator